MKGMVASFCGIGGAGTAAIFGLGGGGPDDFVGTASKSPSAVYAAFAGLGTAGDQVIPTHDGRHRVVQRVVKVPNEQVKLELLVDDKPIVTAEVQLAPEGQGTRIAAELDLDEALLDELMREEGAPPVPAFALQEFLIDEVFARAMGEMVERIEGGRPLLSLAETRSRWGSDRRHSAAPRPGSTRPRPAATQPTLDTRPAIDPNVAARAHLSGAGSGGR